MLKVETTIQKTIDPKGLTDKHFIGLLFCDGTKGHILKLHTNEYIIAAFTSNANTYLKMAISSSIYHLISDQIKPAHKIQIYATLDYEEFKEWYFSK